MAAQCSEFQKDYLLKGKKINLSECEIVEFKYFKSNFMADESNFKCLTLDTIDNYIDGFWNGVDKGGSLYFGIQDDGNIKGTEN